MEFQTSSPGEWERDGMIQASFLHPGREKAMLRVPSLKVLVEAGHLKLSTPDSLHRKWASVLRKVKGPARGSQSLPTVGHDLKFRPLIFSSVPPITQSCPSFLPPHACSSSPGAPEPSLYLACPGYSVLCALCLGLLLIFH